MDDNIQKWKQRKLIKEVKFHEGAHTGFVSLIVPPTYQLLKVKNKIAEEIGQASNIKSRVNRQNVEDALTTINYQLGIMKGKFPNGFAIYCGNVDDKKFVRIIDPILPLKNFLYRCDKLFYTEELESQLEDHEIYGFIIVDGQGYLFAILKGTCVNVIVDRDIEYLPRKHSSGGQSAARFMRRRQDLYHRYACDVAEEARTIFFPNGVCNLKGIVIGGMADCKSQFVKELRPELASKIIKIVDVSGNGKNALHEAINLSSDCLREQELIQQTKVISAFFDLLDKNKTVYGNLVKEYFDNGNIDILIIAENHKDLDYYIENCTNYKTKLEIINDSTSHGTQIYETFNGLAGILRYEMYIDYDESIETDIQSENVEEDFWL